MTAASRYPRHVGLANTIARDFYVPGHDMDDVHQEARVGLWIACRNYNPDLGVPFRSFAAIVIRRRLATFLKAALSEKHRVLTDSSREDVELASGVDVERVVVARDALARLAEAAARLTPLERMALERIVRDLPLDGKADDNARHRVRRKLRAA